ncbi:hypothetical protein AB1Y20_008330 [Prymnesium parvum]|uniref:Methyltransferase FkbM domain-containing protein n=1 Tax=Prymnesium parvum TaxID=97485 RepID=A0AB34IV59_PRYPA
MGCSPEAVEVARHSNCPHDRWQDVVAPLLAAPLGAPAGEAVLVNVGANKGFNLVEFAQRYSSSNLSSTRWHQLMMHEASPPCSLQCCGVCIVCRRPPIAQRAAAASLRLLAFELQPSNERLLRQLAALSGAPIEVHGVAVSNYSGTVYTRDSGRPGYESVSAQTAPSRRAIARRTTRLDDFFLAARLPRAQLVSIDTEGWDGLVLLGMERLLRERRVDVVEFEYMRAWKRVLGERALQRTLEYMEGVGYTCFWQGNRGKLAQASGECWTEEFHTRVSHRWSNLVCAHRPDVLAAFRSLQ